MSKPTIVLHVDFDAFFASVEQRNNPCLRGKPVVVGGDPSGRGVVSTCSYEARVYGIHSGMSMGEALRRCPQAIAVHGEIGSYIDISREAVEIFESYSPRVDAISIDEAFIDFSGVAAGFAQAEELAFRLKTQIKERLGVTCSIGLAQSRLLAKIASRINKPDGLTTVWQYQVKDVIYPLGIEKIWGVGPATVTHLKRFHVYKIADLVALTPSRRKLALGGWGEHLVELLQGNSEKPDWEKVSDLPEKSISHEYTVNININDLDSAYSFLLWLSDKVARRMHRHQWQAGKVGIRVRFPDFKTISREHRLPEPVIDCMAIYQRALELLPKREVVAKGVRLLGVRAAHLTRPQAHYQYQLFSQFRQGNDPRLEKAIDQIRDRFGDTALIRAGSDIFRKGQRRRKGNFLLTRPSSMISFKQ